MWSQADLVAKVRISRSEVEAIPGAHTTRIHTVHHAEVLRVLKGTAKAGASVSFVQVAGQLETKEAVIRVADEEPLTAGEYIIFVRRAPYDTWLHLIGDVDGAYKVVNGLIEAQGRFTSFAREHSGLSEERFLREIDAVAARAGRVR
jgi:hypothetical protein